LDFKRRSPDCQSKAGRLLDVGCGTGHLLKKTMALGWDALGVDPFPRGEAMQHPLSSRIIKGTLGDLPNDCFDIITAVEVIEHVENYRVLLRDMSNFLHPDGELIVTVPYNWEFKAWKNEKNILEPMYGHLWKFDAAGFEKDLRAFFQVVKVEPIYSRTMDRRLLRVIRLFPLTIGLKFSQTFVKFQNNGAWLLGVAQNKKKERLISSNQDPKVSAIYYKDSPEFSCRSL
jgi:SAM-dependent methyltransferase